MNRTLFVVVLAIFALSVSAFSATVCQFNFDSMNYNSGTSRYEVPDVSGNGLDLEYKYTAGVQSSTDPWNVVGNNSVLHKATSGGASPYYHADAINPTAVNLKNGGSNYTLEAWVKPLRHEWLKSIIDIRMAGSNQVHLAINADGTARARHYMTNGWFDAVSPNPIPLNEWTHIASVYSRNGDSTLRLYVNGQEVASTYVGQSIDGNTSAVRIAGYFNGYVDDVRISDHPLEQSELGYFSSFSGEDPEANVVQLKYDMDLLLYQQWPARPDGNNYYGVLDVSGNGHDAVWYGGTSVRGRCADNPFDILGNGAESISVKGKNSATDGSDVWTQAYLSDPFSVDVRALGRSNQITVEGWIKPFEARASKIFYYSGTQGNTVQFNFGVNAEMKPYISRYNGNPWVEIVGEDPIPLNEWTHLAAVFNREGDWTTRIYVNGVEAGSITGPWGGDGGGYGLPNFSEATALSMGIVGGSSGNNYALYDDIRVCNIGLFPEEFGYSETFTKDVENLTSPVVAQFDCDSLGLDNRTLTDISNNNHDASYPVHSQQPDLLPDNPFGDVNSNSVRQYGVNGASPKPYYALMTPSEPFPLNTYHEYTAEGWVKPFALQGSGLVGLNGIWNDNTVVVNLGTNALGQPYGAHYNGNAWRTVIGDDPLPLGEWSHIATTYSYGRDGNVRLYVNGVEVGERVYSGDALPGDYLGNKFIGGSSGLGWSNWLFDDVRISNRALPPSMFGMHASFTADATARPQFDPDARMIATPRAVTITCSTPNSTIRYTTDGTDPTESSAEYTAPVTVNPGDTLKARAWSLDLGPSPIKVAVYSQPPANFNRPAEIPYSTEVVVDGDISEWADATWAPLDEVYSGSPDGDIKDAFYSARWGNNGNTLYVAVKVEDYFPSYTDSFGAWDDHDGIEVYVHTTGTGGTDYSADQRAAQHYLIGVKDSDHDSAWAVLAPGVPIPEDAGFEVAVKVEQDLMWGTDIVTYEMAITPFKEFSVNPGGKTISPLAAGDIIGLDVVAVGNDGWTAPNGYTGMYAENLMLEKYRNYNAFGLHLLTMPEIQYDVVSLSDLKKKADDTAGFGASGVVTLAASGYFYIENVERNTGMRVEMASHGMVVGKVVEAAGTVQTLATGEKALLALVAKELEETGTVTPLIMTNQTIGGSGTEGQAGVAGGVGLNNIGLLVRTTGLVSAASGDSFILDDGSGVSLKAVLTGSLTLPADGKYVAINGVVSCEKDGSEEIQRVILVTSIDVIK